MEAYKPISCSFYDILESLATQKKKVNIQYLENGNVLFVDAIIIDFVIVDKIECLVLSTNQKVRLDWLLEVDGNQLKNFNFC